MRAGPKREVTAPPLDPSHLPQSGAGRVDAFTREYLTVTRGKGARGRFRLRTWQSRHRQAAVPDENTSSAPGAVVHAARQQRQTGSTQLSVVVAL